MNVALLRKVQRSLIRQSKDRKHCRFDMAEFGSPNFSEDAPVCHTAACIAGEAVLQAGLGKIDRQHGGINLTPKADKKYDQSLKLAAQDALGLTDAQTDRLFYLPDMWMADEGWPAKIAKAYNEAKFRTTKAAIGARRIAQFIRSKGKR